MKNKSFKLVADGMQNNDNPFMLDLSAKPEESDFMKKEVEIVDYDNYVEYKNVMPSGWL